MKTIPNDYLKFWRIIRYYMKVKYGLTQSDLDMILFLYSEGYFSSLQFKEYGQIISWEMKRFTKLVRQGWIEVFRKRNGLERGLYQLSYKAKRVVSDIYLKLSGEEIPTTLGANPMFAKNVSYTDKVYRNMIKQMNEYQRAQKLKKLEENRIK